MATTPRRFHRILRRFLQSSVKGKFSQFSFFWGSVHWPLFREMVFIWIVCWCRFLFLFATLLSFIGIFFGSIPVGNRSCFAWKKKHVGKLRRASLAFKGGHFGGNEPTATASTTPATASSTSSTTTATTNRNETQICTGWCSTAKSGPALELFSAGAHGCRTSAASYESAPPSRDHRIPGIESGPRSLRGISRIIWGGTAHRLAPQTNVRRPWRCEKKTRRRRPFLGPPSPKVGAGCAMASRRRRLRTWIRSSDSAGTAAPPTAPAPTQSSSDRRQRRRVNRVFWLVRDFDRDGCRAASGVVEGFECRNETFFFVFCFRWNLPRATGSGRWWLRRPTSRPWRSGVAALVRRRRPVASRRRDHVVPALLLELRHAAADGPRRRRRRRRRPRTLPHRSDPRVCRRRAALARTAGPSPGVR